MASDKLFTKLDFSQAYLQIPLDDSSKGLLVINTPRGCFIIVHGCLMAFPQLLGSFKDSWRTYYKGLSHVAVYVRGHLITGVSEEDH